MMQGSDDHRNSQTSPVLAPGVTVAHYTIVEKIGEGGMGEVFLADDTRLRRQVALKFMPLKYVGDEELKKRFAREAQSIAALSHPNVVTVHDTQNFHGRPYIVMEYVNGRSLKELIRDRELSSTEVLNLAIQAAEGLERAHQSGVVHRDMKSDNLLVTDSGKLKILDFGLAKAERDENLTQTGVALGTVAYMSPEQTRGANVDQRSDLFSLGIILYELSYRRLPFAGNNMAAIVNAILNEEADFSSSGSDALSSGLVRIISGLLKKDTTERYQSASDLLADLRRLQQGITPALGFETKRSSAKPVVFTLASVVLVLLVLRWFNLPPFTIDSVDNGKRKMLAVLPFDNVGGSGDDYFANGITDEITTHLTKLSAIGVISRSSATQYRASDKTHLEIADELGVGFILEGSIQWDRQDTSERVRIRTTLTRAEDGVSLWAESYNRVLRDIFAVQTDIAQKVSEALNVTLLEAEQQSLRGEPTADLDAYDFYLQGMSYFRIRDWTLAETMFRQAVDSDSSFALAWAALSRTHSIVYWWYFDRSDARLEAARIAAEASLQLDNGLAEAHLAMGRYWYRGFLDYDQALDHYDIALKIQPNNSDLMFAIGSVKRRQGNWDGALGSYSDAVTLDPRSRTKLTNLARTYQLMRKFELALQTVERLIALTPDYAGAYQLKASVLALGLGRMDNARNALQEAELHVDPLELVDITVTLDILDGRHASALERLNSIRHTDYFANDSSFYFLQKGEVLLELSQLGAARATFDTASLILSELVQQAPNEAQYRSMLGVAYAGLGQRDEAIEQGRKATELYPVTVDAMTGTSWRQNLATIYAMTGNDSLALVEIEYLLSVPSDLTSEYLRLHPAFKRMKHKPQFQALLKN